MSNSLRAGNRGNKTAAWSPAQAGEIGETIEKFTCRITLSYGKQQTSDSSSQFLQLKNEQMKMSRNNSYGWNKLPLPFDEILNLSILIAGFAGSRNSTDTSNRRACSQSEFKFFRSNSNINIICCEWRSTTYLMAVVLS